jgi:hypothetical protein
MPMRRSWPVLIVVPLASLLVFGCTRSLELTYTPSLYRLAQADQLRGVVLGVGKLQDRRSWIERTSRGVRAT